MALGFYYAILHEVKNHLRNRYFLSLKVLIQYDPVTSNLLEKIKKASLSPLL